MVDDEKDDKTHDIEEYIAEKMGVRYHPSYGYASSRQIEELKSIGVGPRRDQLLKDIARQTAAMKRGKKTK
jgi:hypothetical protein